MPWLTGAAPARPWAPAGYGGGGLPDDEALPPNRLTNDRPWTPTATTVGAISGKYEPPVNDEIGVDAVWETVIAVWSVGVGLCVVVVEAIFDDAMSRAECDLAQDCLSASKPAALLACGAWGLSVAVHQAFFCNLLCDLVGGIPTTEPDGGAPQG